MLQDSSRGHVAVMATPKSASGQTRLRSSQGEVVHAELACPVSSDHHQWGIVGLRSLVASCMAACMFVWWRKRVCSTVMFTIYVMHAIRAFFRLPPSAALVELDDSVSYIGSGVITNRYRLMQLCCMAG